MASSKRPPITYPGQFGGGLFRPKDVVAREQNAVPGARSTLVESAPVPDTQQRKTKRPIDGSNDRSPDRVRTRHSFDVFQDQLLALAEMQATIFKATGRKPTLGELVQQALDAYIAHDGKRTTGRTDDQVEDQDAI